MAEKITLSQDARTSDRPSSQTRPKYLDTSLLPLAEIHVQTLAELRHCTLRNFSLRLFVLEFQ